MALKIPSTLRLGELKALAFKCGLLSSGTKPILTSRLYDEISSVAPAARSRILSIDMGIRNLAYCILDVPLKKTTRAEIIGTASAQGKIPMIREWRRLAVSSAPVSSSASGLPLVKEAFDPTSLSKAAYTLLRERLLPEKPTHILIERQRFRSMGSKQILEWTIRVNMFESILYAVLCTLKAEGVWSGEVVGVTPGKVGPFWLGEEDVVVEAGGAGNGHKKERKSKNAKVKNKGLKIDLVRRWLEAGDVAGLGNEAVEEMARQYMEKWDRAPGARKGGKLQKEDGQERMGKLDDLADSLLQGMAWIQWEENKRLALNHGVEILLDLEPKKSGKAK
jgi:cruciform cutting endonuclease 1